MENCMKKYLDKDYNPRDHIYNFLRYWQKGDNKPKGDKWRKENELDCLYYDGVKEQLLGDTIVPMWALVRMVASYISGKRISKKMIEELIKGNSSSEEYFPKNNELVQALEELAILAEQRQNYMLLKCRAMNRRGEMQLPATLYNCFCNEKGIPNRFLREYFNNDENSVVKWIERERLECAFINKNVSVDNIIKIENVNINTSVTRSRNPKLIKAVIEYSKRILEEREKALNE